MKLVIDDHRTVFLGISVKIGAAEKRKRKLKDIKTRFEYPTRFEHFKTSSVDYKDKYIASTAERASNKFEYYSDAEAVTAVKRKMVRFEAGKSFRASRIPICMTS